MDLNPLIVQIIAVAKANILESAMITLTASTLISVIGDCVYAYLIKTKVPDIFGINNYLIMLMFLFSLIENLLDSARYSKIFWM